MLPDSLPLVIGLPAVTLAPQERAVLEEVRPAGVILFARNIEAPDQVPSIQVVLPVDLISRLMFPRKPWIQGPPTFPRDSPERVAIDIGSRIECQFAIRIHDHREVRILEREFLFSVGLRIHNRG